MKKHVRMIIWFDSFLNKYFGSHISIGRLTIYGRNAMHWAWNYRTKKGLYLCFAPTTFSWGLDYFTVWPWYFYISPDGTPTEAIWGIGSGVLLRGRRGNEK